VVFALVYLLLRVIGLIAGSSREQVNSEVELVALCLVARRTHLTQW